MDRFQGMNQFLKDKLRAPTMTAHDAPDGGDRQLQDAANMLADEAGEIGVTPPFPVPLMTPIRRDEGMRGEASETWLVNPPATLPGLGVLVMGGQAERGSQFPINSIRVDNLTSQWMYWPENGVFVPPFWYGRVFRFTGALVQRVKFETPTGLTALASATTEVARVVFSEDYWEESSGSSSAGNMAPTSTGAPSLAVAIVDESSGLFAEVVLPGDALAAQDGVATVTQLEVFNGTTWDRARAASLASGNQTTGIPAMASHVFDTIGSNWRPQDGGRNRGDADTAASMAATVAWMFNGATFDRPRLANVFKQINNVALGAGSTATVWTPAAGKKPRLMGWVVDGVSGLVDAAITFFETSTTGTFMGDVGYIAGLGAPSYVSYGLSGPIVSTSSAVIVAFSSTAVTFRGTLWGTEE